MRIEDDFRGVEPGHGGQNQHRDPEGKGQVNQGGPEAADQWIDLPARVVPVMKEPPFERVGQIAAHCEDDRLQRGQRPATRQPADGQHDRQRGQRRDRDDEEPVLGAVKQPDRWLADQCAEADEKRDVDQHRGNQAGRERQAWHIADAGGLSRMNPQPGDQATGEDGRRTASSQQLDRPFQRRPEAQRIRNLHHGGLPHGGENLAADHGPDHRRQQQRGNHGDRVHRAAGDSDAGDHQQQVARRKGHGNPTLLDEHQPRDDGDQEITAQVRDRADRVHQVAPSLRCDGR